MKTIMGSGLRYCFIRVAQVLFAHGQKTKIACPRGRVSRDGTRERGAGYLLREGGPVAFVLVTPTRHCTLWASRPWFLLYAQPHPFRDAGAGPAVEPDYAKSVLSLHPLD